MADPIKMEMEKDEEEYFVTLHVKEIKNEETTIKEGKRSHIFFCLFVIHRSNCEIFYNYYKNYVKFE